MEFVDFGQKIQAVLLIGKYIKVDPGKGLGSHHNLGQFQSVKRSIGLIILQLRSDHF